MEEKIHHVRGKEVENKRITLNYYCYCTFFQATVKKEKVNKLRKRNLLFVNNFQCSMNKLCIGFWCCILHSDTALTKSDVTVSISISIPSLLHIDNTKEIPYLNRIWELSQKSGERLFSLTKDRISNSQHKMKEFYSENKNHLQFISFSVCEFKTQHAAI